jgi:hypothetical protein
VPHHRCNEKITCLQPSHPSFRPRVRLPSHPPASTTAAGSEMREIFRKVAAATGGRRITENRRPDQCSMATGATGILPSSLCRSYQPARSENPCAPAAGPAHVRAAVRPSLLQGATDSNRAGGARAHASRVSSPACQGAHPGG